ncbi:MAG: hypothetical protein KDK44_03270 [Chlamydiia bacterium]|nr:hypothetical protein [Chlamydiia bacterium]
MKFKITRKDKDIIASVMVFKEKWWLWVISVRNLVLYGIPAVLGLTLLISYAAFNRPEHQVDFLNAQKSYEQWENGNEDKLAKLEQILGQHPELHGKYDVNIAAHLLAIEKGIEAKGYAMQTLKRTDGTVPFHTQYAKTSVKIAEGSLEEALNEAMALKEALSGKQDAKVLYGFNLMRIAALQRELEHLDAEKAALKELQAYLAQNKEDQELSLLAQHFQTGIVGLDDYIAYRQAAH